MTCHVAVKRVLRRNGSLLLRPWQTDLVLIVVQRKHGNASRYQEDMKSEVVRARFMTRQIACGDGVEA